MSSNGRLSLTKIEDHTYVFQTKHFSQKPEKQSLWASPFLEIL